MSYLAVELWLKMFLNYSRMHVDFNQSSLVYLPIYLLQIVPPLAFFSWKGGSGINQVTRLYV